MNDLTKSFVDVLYRNLAATTECKGQEIRGVGETVKPKKIPGGTGIGWQSSVLAFFAILASCGGGKAEDSLATHESSSPPKATEVPADPSSCQGFTNLIVGVIEPADVDDVREVHADAQSPAEGEQWVRVAVAGDYDGVSPAWTVYALSFALKNAAGDNTYQIKRRPADLTDDEAVRIESYQYYLVSDPVEDLALVCATADADWVLGS